jgi:hypothetical protein
LADTAGTSSHEVFDGGADQFLYNRGFAEPMALGNSTLRTAQETAVLGPAV